MGMNKNNMGMTLEKNAHERPPGWTWVHLGSQDPRDSSLSSRLDATEGKIFKALWQQPNAGTMSLADRGRVARKTPTEKKTSSPRLLKCVAIAATVRRRCFLALGDVPF